MSNRLNLTWEPPGPVSAAFMAARDKVQIINGPIGSGKTTTVLMKAVTLAATQKPSTRERVQLRQGGPWLPVRKTRGCVVRDTYRQLWKTTMASWFQRVPKDQGTFTGADGAPASHRITFTTGDGTAIDLQMDFLAIGENAVEDVLRGYEPTWFYLNEMDLLAGEVLTYAAGRAGRYPVMAEGGPSWSGVLGDCNAPTYGSWIYDDIFCLSDEAMRAKGIALFRQPSGRSPRAENIRNLPPGYYANQVKLNPDWYVRRMIDNVPGYSRDGKPVFPEFIDSLHVPHERIEPRPGIALGVGLDAGLNPAAAFAQRMPNGRWHCIGELVGPQGMGPIRFGELLAQELHERYPMIRTIRGYADPSAAYGADAQGGEQSWIEIVAARSGIPIVPAPTNRLIPRLEAIRLPLTRLIDGEPGFQLSSACPTLRQGFNAGYRFRKMNVVGADRYVDEPEKNAFSHPMDALGYVLSAGGEDIEIRERRGEQARGRQRAVEHEWDPLGRR